MDPTNRLLPKPISTASSVCLGLCNHDDCLCNARPTLKHSILPHNTEDMASIDVTYRQTIDGLVLPKSHAILDVSCRPPAHRFHEVLSVPQSLNSLREYGLQATYSIGQIIEQNLQANKKNIRKRSYIIIRINKHYSHIIHDVPHPFG